MKRQENYRRDLIGRLIQDHEKLVEDILYTMLQRDFLEAEALLDDAMDQASVEQAERHHDILEGVD